MSRLILMTDHEGHIAAATLLGDDDQPASDETTGMDAHTFAAFLNERNGGGTVTEVHALNDAN